MSLGSSPKHARDGSRSLPPSTPQVPQVKRERSPSPKFAVRRLVSCGTRRFAPIPEDCLPSCADYERNRSKWVARCVEELEALNLISERRLVRDDGLIIDWRSHVPVWSDTLRPDPLDLAATIMLAHRSNAHRRHRYTESPKKSTISTQRRLASSIVLGDVSDAETLSKKKLPVPSHPSKRRNNAFQPIPNGLPASGSGASPHRSERPRFPAETERGTASRSHSSPHDAVSSLADHVPVPSDISTRHDQVAVPSSAHEQLVVPCIPVVVEEVMSEMTLSYLRRYVQTYEADRASLASAYARNASFAYRVHQVLPATSGGAPFIWAISPRRFSSGPKRTRLDIVTTLLTLPRLHSHAQSPAIAQVEYDIFYLGVELGMFVVCRVATPTQTVVHNIILQRKEVDVEDAASEGVWPLTATAHQILVFQV